MDLASQLPYKSASDTCHEGYFNLSQQVKMEEDDDPRAPLLPAEGRVYRRRWYILMIFGMINFLQNVVWNTWGPIAQSAEVVFEWTDSQIGQFANMGNIAYLITVFPVCYLIEKLGT